MYRSLIITARRGALIIKPRLKIAILMGFGIDEDVRVKLRLN